MSDELVMGILTGLVQLRQEFGEAAFQRAAHRCRLEIGRALCDAAQKRYLPMPERNVVVFDRRWTSRRPRAHRYPPRGFDGVPPVD